MDIEALAIEAGLWRKSAGVWMVLGGSNEIEQFAALVTASEREACAKVCDELVDTAKLMEIGSEKEVLEICAESIRERSNV